LANLESFPRIKGGMDTCFHSMELNGPPPEDQRRILYGETLNKTKRLRIGEQTPARPSSAHTGPTERLLADSLIVADWPKQAEDPEEVI